MLTVLLYVVVMVIVGAVLFAAASAVFGRGGEVLAPIPPGGTTATVLPATDVTGVDVRDLRFQQVVRGGYKTSEVDWPWTGWPVRSTACAPASPNTRVPVARRPTVRSRTAARSRTAV